MSLIPNEPASQLVTRTDMHGFGSELRMAELRGDIAKLDARITSEIANLRVHTTRLVSGSVAAHIIAFEGIAAV